MRTRELRRLIHINQCLLLRITINHRVYMPLHPYFTDESLGQVQGQHKEIPGGGVRIRTGVRGFAGPCLTARPRRQKYLAYLAEQ